MLQGIPAIMASMAGIPLPSISLVQSAIYLSTSNPTSHTIGSGNGWATPVSGNVIVLTVVSDNTISDATLLAGGWVQVANAVDNSGTYMYWKVSNGTESSVTVNLSAIASCDLGLLEIKGVSTLDKSASAIGQGPTSVGTGTTATTTQANEIVIALIGVAPGGGAPPTVTAYSNSFVSQRSGVSSGIGVPVQMDFAILIVNATGTYTTTGTLSASTTAHNSGIIATFK